jgi:hypothetical protein
MSAEIRRDILDLEKLRAEIAQELSLARFAGAPLRLVIV